LQTVTRLVEQMADQSTADLATLRLQRLRQGGARSCRSTATAIPDHRASSARPAPRDPGARRVPRFREGRLLEIAGLRPAPGRRTRPDGSSCANSFRPPPDGARRDPDRHRRRHNLRRTPLRLDQTTAPIAEPYDVIQLSRYYYSNDR
jgi:hypothetical protein